MTDYPPWKPIVRSQEERYRMWNDALSMDEKKILLSMSAEPLSSLTADSVSGVLSVAKNVAESKLSWLVAKKLLVVEEKSETLYRLGSEGVVYAKNGLPEANLLDKLRQVGTVKASEIENAKIAIANAKNAGSIVIEKGIVRCVKPEITFEQERKILETLGSEPMWQRLDDSPALRVLLTRPNVIEMKEAIERVYHLTDLGYHVIVYGSLDPTTEAIGDVTPEMLQKGTWKGQKFKPYLW